MVASVGKENFLALESVLGNLSAHLHDTKNQAEENNWGSAHATATKHLSTAIKHYAVAKQLRDQNKGYDAAEPTANAAMYAHAANEALHKNKDHSANQSPIDLNETARISKIASKLASAGGKR